MGGQGKRRTDDAPDVIDDLLRRFARIVADELRGHDPRMVEQSFSVLGRRKHIAACKRRVAEALSRGMLPSELGAAIDGDRFFLSQESIAEELGKRTRASLAKTRGLTPVANDTSDASEEAAYRKALARARAARGDQQ